MNACMEILKSPLESVRNKYMNRATKTQESISRLEKALREGITAQVSFNIYPLYIGPYARAVPREGQPGEQELKVLHLKIASRPSDIARSAYCKDAKVGIGVVKIDCVDAPNNPSSCRQKWY